MKIPLHATSIVVAKLTFGPLQLHMTGDLLYIFLSQGEFNLDNRKVITMKMWYEVELD